MNQQMAKVEATLEEAVIKEHCKQLRMPTVSAQFVRMAEDAGRKNLSHIRYLNLLLHSEIEERERHIIERRIKEARLPRVKTLEEFDFTQSPKLSANQIYQLARGQYLDKTEPVIFIGECGTG